MVAGGELRAECGCERCFGCEEPYFSGGDDFQLGEAMGVCACVAGGAGVREETEREE